MTNSYYYELMLDGRRIIVIAHEDLTVASLITKLKELHPDIEEVYAKAISQEDVFSLQKEKIPGHTETNLIYNLQLMEYNRYQYIERVPKPHQQRFKEFRRTKPSGKHKR